MKKHILPLAFLAAILPSLALAQGTSHGGHGSHGASAAETPATKAYRAANEKMHKDMDIAYSGNSDIDFVRGMIPHHEGAIAMAKIALENTKDEQIRKWATDVIREQEREIAEMRAWLRKKGAL